MGDTFGDGDSDEKPVHEVCVGGFWMGKYEVTQAQYRKVTGSSPSRYFKGDRRPVENVSWHDAQGFINKLKQQTGKRFSLPTEAQWEYAARSRGRKGRSIQESIAVQASVAWQMMITAEGKPVQELRDSQCRQFFTQRSWSV